MAKAKLEMLERRPDIVATALRIFSQRGYEATSVRDIAEEVGLLKGSLYHYIDSKDDLLYVILLRVHSELASQWAAVEKEVEGGDVERIEAFIVSHVTYITDNLDGIGVFLREFRSLDTRRRRQIIRKRDQYEAVLHDLIESAAPTSVYRDLDVSMATLSVFGMMNWVSQWYKPGKSHSAETVAHEIAGMCLRMLGMQAEAPA